MAFTNLLGLKVIRPEIILQFEGKTKKIARSIIRKIKSKEVF